MKKFGLMLVVLGVLAAGAASAADPVMYYQKVNLTRNHGAVTGSLDSTQFLLTARGTTTIGDTLAPVDISTWDITRTFNAGATTNGAARVWVVFNNSSTTGASGDSLGCRYQVSPDGTYWTDFNTEVWATAAAAGSNVLSIPLLVDPDERTNALANLHLARYVRIVLAADVGTKPVVRQVYIAHY